MRNLWLTALDGMVIIPVVCQVMTFRQIMQQVLVPDLQGIYIGMDLGIIRMVPTFGLAQLLMKIMLGTFIYRILTTI